LIGLLIGVILTTLGVYLGRAEGATQPQVHGTIDMSASKSSVTALEQYSVSSEMELRNGKLGAMAMFDFSNTQTKEQLETLMIDAGLQGNYFHTNHLYNYLGFLYQADTSAGYDHRKNLELGIGYRAWDEANIFRKNFSIQSGLVAASIYTDSVLDRRFLSKTKASLVYPLGDVFSLEEGANFELNLDNMHRHDRWDQYELDTQTAICANLDTGLKLRAYHKWDYEHEPLAGPKDRRETGVSLGVVF